LSKVSQNGLFNLRVWASDGVPEIISEMNETSIQVRVITKGDMIVNHTLKGRDRSKGTVSIKLSFDRPENISANGVTNNDFTIYRRLI
jgi:hypothetical protein